MAAKTITIPTPKGDLIFRKPDDGEAMRLLRAFLRVAVQPQNPALAVTFLEQFGELLITRYDRQFVEVVILKDLPAEHPNRKLSHRALWLAVQFGEDAAARVRAVELLTGLPGGALGG